MAILSNVIVFSVFGFFIVVIGLLIFSIRQWNIPVIILRYQGDKSRPMVLVKRAKKQTIDGVTRLWVRGYKTPFRDFKSEFYYPYVKGKNGALILWEPKPGMLTPTPPKRVKGVKYQDHKRFVKAYTALQSEMMGVGLKPVMFDFDKDLYDQLLIKAVDDTDIDFLLQHYARIDVQYRTGWRDFIAQYASHIVLIIIAVLLLAGFIVWLDKAPNWAGQCLQAAKDQADSYLKDIALDQVRPPG